jgi:hypothetical protein
VAFLTGSLGFTLGEFAFMKIRMTVTTGGELKCLPLLTRRVTFIAGHGGMFAYKRILGPAVVKLGLVGDMPAISRVAILAVVSELSLVDVGMTIGALLESQTCEFGKT